MSHCVSCLDDQELSVVCIVMIFRVVSSVCSLVFFLSVTIDHFLVWYMTVVFFFFFQAEDGIRDVAVTGVQTCALPISPRGTWGSSWKSWAPAGRSSWTCGTRGWAWCGCASRFPPGDCSGTARSS